MFPLWGNGSASYLRALSSELVARGHSVAIVSPDKRKLPGVTHYLVTPPQMGVFLGHPELSGAKKFSDMNGREIGEIFVSYLKTSIDTVADFNPEIIHSFHTFFLPPVARILKLLFGIRIIITSHGSDLHYLAEDRRLNGLIGDANRISAAITVCNDFTKSLYLKLFGMSLKRKIKIIPGGVSLVKIADSQKHVNEINKKYGLKGQKLVLYTGRLIKSKGLDYLIKAAPLIEGKILIVGDGPAKKDLVIEVKKKKLKNVVFVDYIGDKGYLHAFYERADVYVSPTIWKEPFGMTLLDAMAAHTPVVTSNKGGTNSIITDKVNGFLIPPRNAKIIANTVNMLLNNDILRESIGEAAYKTVVEKFTWQRITDRFEKLYQQYRFTTSEYLKIVKGEDPKLSPIISSIHKIMGKDRETEKNR